MNFLSRFLDAVFPKVSEGVGELTETSDEVVIAVKEAIEGAIASE